MSKLEILRDFLKEKLDNLKHTETVSDFIISDFDYDPNNQTLVGYIVRDGDYDYGEKGIKTKDWDNLKEVYGNTEKLIAYGSKMTDSHLERDDRTIGYFDNFQLVEKGKQGIHGEKDVDEKFNRIAGTLHTSKNISELSDLDINNLKNLPVSASYDDRGRGNIQKISQLHHIAVSLNAKERDRCSSAGGSSCNINLLQTNGARDTNDLHADSVIESDFQTIKNYTKKSVDTTMTKKDIKNEEIEETEDMSDKKEVDEKDLGDDYDEDDEKENSMKKKPSDEKKDLIPPIEEKPAPAAPALDIKQLADMIESAVKKATAPMMETIEDFQKEKAKRETDQAEDLRQILTKDPYGFAEEAVKDMSLPELQSTKSIIENSKLFKDFETQNKPMTQISIEEVNREVIQQAQDFISGARQKYWGNVLHYFPNGEQK